ncbi:MAG: sugar-binding transcriptional regulator [Devosiaceae bacterium]|nr:sugar-binding transcriptional regulator [Devosiaceae bacterium MH13]
MAEGKTVKDVGHSEAQLAHVAMLYYREGLTQSEIAQRIGLSRATIVNYLRLARDLGIVDIRIRGESFTASPLSRQLTERFGLADCYIAHHDMGPQNDEAVLERVAQLAASALHDLLEPSDRLGVAWGETVQQVARKFPNGPIPNLNVHQMVGTMDFNPRFVPEACAIEIARRTLASCRTLHAPAVISTAALASQLRAEPVIARQLEELASLSKALFSVGSLSVPQTLVGSGMATHEELQVYLDRGAKGVFWGHFVDGDGAAVEGPLSGRVIGASLDDVRAVPVRMLVACGPTKREAIGAALRGGFATHLVTDEETASFLLGRH